MNASAPQPGNSLPWYRSPMLLLALALPLLTVVAGVVTYRIAAQDATDSDPDAVRRIAQMQTADMARDENALRLGLAGEARFDAASGSVRVQLGAETAEVSLQLRLTHATQAQFDQNITLSRIEDSVWIGKLIGPRHGNYNVSLNASDAGWRLVGRLDAKTDQLRLLPALGQNRE
jgi:uncharacterized protein